MAAANHNDAADVATNRRLVLCFDGTGNKFSGDTSDTNIVKLYQMFDRKKPEQFHYYQRQFRQLSLVPSQNDKVKG